MRIIFAKFEIVLFLNFNLNKVEIFTIDCSGHWICKKKTDHDNYSSETPYDSDVLRIRSSSRSLLFKKVSVILIFDFFDFLPLLPLSLQMASFRNINVSKNCLVIFWEERLEKERFSRANRMSRRLLKCQENWRILSHTQGK